MSNVKTCPPVLMSDLEYEKWKKDIIIWTELTDIPKEKQALAIHLSLKGKSRNATSQIPLEKLRSEDGVDEIFVKLDRLFLMDKGRQQFAVFQKLYNLKRKPEESIEEFLLSFESVFFEFVNQGLNLPGEVAAFMLLSSCNLKQMEVQMVMSAIEDVEYEKMATVIKRIFSSDTKKSCSDSNTCCELKTEPILYNAEDSTEFCGLTGYRAKGNKSNPRNRSYPSYEKSNVNNQQNQRLNRRDRFGNVSRCAVCDSRYHWARDCPHSSNHKNAQSDQPSDSQVHLFVGYAGNGTYENNLEDLLNDSYKCCVLDSGCSLTVCGEDWLNNYISSLSEQERSLVKEESSNATFTFGDSTSVRSKKKVILPCHFGTISGTVTTDVVSCKIPMLLSKKSMKKANMVIDFSNDSLKFGKELFHLRSSRSGHYLLTLSR